MWRVTLIVLLATLFASSDARGGFARGAAGSKIGTATVTSRRFEHKSIWMHPTDYNTEVPDLTMFRHARGSKKEKKTQKLTKRELEAAEAALRERDYMYWYHWGGM